MRCLLVYSSVTGNTRAVAEAIREAMPEGAVMRSVQKAPSPDEFACIILGFWVHRAGPDPLMARYMQRVRGKKTAFFGTLAAYPDSEHAQKVIARAEELLEGNVIAGSFLCQGGLSEKRLAERLAGDGDARHPMTEERRARLLEAARHPDKRDFAQARDAFRAWLAQWI